MANNGQDLLDRCREASNEAIAKSTDLTNFIAGSRAQLLEASNEFFSELFDLAKAIGGEYEKTALTPQVQSETLSKLDALVAGGEKIKAIADDAETHVDTTDEEIADIVDNKLTPTLNEANQRQASLNQQISSVREEVLMLQDRANHQRQSVNEAQNQLEDAQRRLSEDEENTAAAQFGNNFAWAFTPLGGDPIRAVTMQKARDHVNDARNNLNNAVRALMESNDIVAAAQNREREVESRSRDISNALATITPLLSVTEASRKHCNELRNPISDLKNRQDKLVGVLGEMQNAASTAELDTRKKVLGSYILKIISMALIDMTLIAPAKAVQDELCHNDDQKKSITEGLAEQLKELEATEAAINAAQLHLASA